MIEIEYDREKGRFQFFHDSKYYSNEDLRKHLSINGHPNEVVGYAIPFDLYEEGKKVLEDINSFLEKNRMFL